MQKGQVTYTDNGVLMTHEMYKEVLGYQSEILYLRQELTNLKRMIFGSKSERHVGSDTSQLTLGFEPETIEPPTKEVEEITYTRNKPESKKGSAIRLALPSHLPREEHIIEPQGDLASARKIGEVITELLDYTPGKFHVVRYRRPKYVVNKDEKVIIGDLPSFPIPRGNAAPGLLTHLLISKFVDHLPFYRQVQQFKRENITIAESTISGWFNASTRLLEPLYQRLISRVQESGYLMADETPIPVQTKDKPGSTHKGYHWVYYSPLERLVCFDYRSSRGRDGPSEFLDRFQGILQTDGYNAYDIYDKKEGIILCGCMAHARRKFENSKENDSLRAEYVLGQMQKLYAVERQARQNELSAIERRDLRIEKSLPILQELEVWLKAQLPEVLPKSSIGKAISYTLSLWHRLSRYVDNGEVEIDNNLVENSIRPVALGRKNYLFAGSHEAARQAAMIYSFLGTCKINNIEPYAWLKETISRIPDHSIQKLDELLPVKKTL